MPRDIAREIIELKQGLHQFIMSMYNVIDKVVEEKEAKSQIISVLQGEIDYIRSTDSSLQKEINIVKILEQKKEELTKQFKTEKDENKRYEIGSTIDCITDVIRFLNRK
jgi:actin-related protein